MSASSILRIGYVSAMWRRPDLTRLVFRHVARLREELAGEMEIVPAVAGSEGDVSRKIAEECGFLYAEVPNAPLGAKWNAALGLLRDRNVDGACIFGSDDLANAAWFRTLCGRVAGGGGELLGVRGMHFLDRRSGRLAFWEGYPPPRERDTPGAGRFIGRRILDLLDWRLWPDGQERGLDGAMLARIQERLGPDAAFAHLPADSGEIIVDVKAGTVINPFERMLGAGGMTLIGSPCALLASRFGAELADELLPPGIPRLAGEDRKIGLSPSGEPLPLEFERRSGILACPADIPMMEAVAAAWLKRSLRRTANIFLLSRWISNDFQDMGIHFFVAGHLPRAPQIFRAAICVRETWPAAAVAAAAGTPVICVGPLPAGMGADSGPLPAGNLDEGMRLAEALHAGADLWENASQRMTDCIRRHGEAAGTESSS